MLYDIHFGFVLQPPLTHPHRYHLCFYLLVGREEEAAEDKHGRKGPRPLPYEHSPYAEERRRVAVALRAHQTALTAGGPASIALALKQERRLLGPLAASVPPGTSAFGPAATQRRVAAAVAAAMAHAPATLTSASAQVRMGHLPGGQGGGVGGAGG
jgi:hypothetical protein